MADLNDTLQKIVGRIKKLENSAQQPTADAIGGYWTTMGPWDTFVPRTVAGGIGTLSVPRTLTIRKVKMVVNVLTTNDVSNFWTLRLSRIPTGGGAGTAIVNGFSTGAAASVWQELNFGSVTQVITYGTDFYLYMEALKTGAPGPLYWASPMIFFT